MERKRILKINWLPIEVHNIEDADVLGNNPIYDNGQSNWTCNWWRFWF